MYPNYIFIEIKTNQLTNRGVLRQVLRAYPAAPNFLEPLPCPHEQPEHKKINHRKKQKIPVNYLFAVEIAKIYNWKCNLSMTSDVRLSVPKM